VREEPISAHDRGLSALMVSIARKKGKAVRVKRTIQERKKIRDGAGSNTYPCGKGRSCPRKRGSIKKSREVRWKRKGSGEKLSAFPNQRSFLRSRGKLHKNGREEEGPATKDLEGRKIPLF